MAPSSISAFHVRIQRGLDYPGALGLPSTASQRSPFGDARGACLGLLPPKGGVVDGEAPTRSRAISRSWE